MKKILVSSIVSLTVISSSNVFAASFKDTTNHWASQTIDWAATEKLVNGYPDGTFKPNKTVSEAEFLTMLINAYSATNKNFVKLQHPRHWADDYYNFAKMMNYPTNGFDDTKKREWVITRQRVAEIVAGTQGKNYTGNDAIQYLLRTGLARGNDPLKITIGNYGAESTLTRAEAVQFIKNIKEKGTQTLQPRPFDPSAALPKIGVNDQITPTPQNPTPQQQQPTTQNTTTQQTPSSVIPVLHEKPATDLKPWEQMRMQPDAATKPTVQAFLDNIKFENGTVKIVIPKIPDGYTGRFYGAVPNQPVREGDTFTFSYNSTTSFGFSVFQGTVEKNSVIVTMPSGAYYWRTAQ